MPVSLVVKASGPDAAKGPHSEAPLYGLDLAVEEARGMRYKYAGIEGATVEIVDAVDGARMFGWTRVGDQWIDMARGLA